MSATIVGLLVFLLVAILLGWLTRNAWGAQRVSAKWISGVVAVC